MAGSDSVSDGGSKRLKPKGASASDSGKENKVTDIALLSPMKRPKGRPPGWVRKGKPGGWRGGGDWETVAFDPMAQEAWINYTYVLAGPRYASRVRASVNDFASGVAYSRASGALDWEPRKPFFTATTDAVSAAVVRAATIADPVAYRLIVRTLINGRMIDRAFVREYFARVERALGCRLAWAAAIHCKPSIFEEGNRHFHAIIRGITVEGDELRLLRSFRYHGFRAIARQLMTERAGLITPEQMNRIEEIRERNAPVHEKWELLLRAGWPWWKVRAWIANYTGEKKEKQWWVHRQDPHPGLRL